MGPDSPPKSRSVRSNREVTSLSQENLRTLELSHVESDTHYAENVVHAEGQMMAYQEMWRKQEQARKRDSGLAFSLQEGEQQNDYAVDGLKIPKRPRASVETPFRRYVTIGPGEDPFPLYGKQAMEEMPVKYGSLEDAEARRDAAMAIEQAVKRDRGERHTI
ncbi:hypothetical protein SLS57_001172 [Botryosphaeria dothidea]